MATTKIVNCTCKHDYQDSKYGAGMRVHNRSDKDTSVYKCTVCGRTQQKAKVKEEPAKADPKKETKK
jgi:hypothetical protein